MAARAPSSLDRTRGPQGAPAAGARGRRAAGPVHPPLPTPPSTWTFSEDHPTSPALLLVPKVNVLLRLTGAHGAGTGSCRRPPPFPFLPSTVFVLSPSPAPFSPPRSLALSASVFTASSVGVCGPALPYLCNNILIDAFPHFLKVVSWCFSPQQFLQEGQPPRIFPFALLLTASWWWPSQVCVQAPSGQG